MLNSTGSEFCGFLKDEYTTLQETSDRVLATAVTARWRHARAGGDWRGSYDARTRHLLEAFAETLQPVPPADPVRDGRARADQPPEVCEVRLALPNKHHFPVDLSPFGLDNDNEVFFAADRPYGLIEGSVLREDAPDAGSAWE